jgi:hypothetical protein
MMAALLTIAEATFSRPRHARRHLALDRGRRLAPDIDSVAARFRLQHFNLTFI